MGGGLAPGAREASRLRLPGTRDVFERLWLVGSERIALLGYPQRPVATFNPGLLVEGDKAYLYLRVVAGYYKYVSAIARASLGLEELLSRSPPERLEATLLVTPGEPWDFWGAEDPRAYRLAGQRLITYTGRTAGYFDLEAPTRYTPVTRADLGDRVGPALVVEHEGEGDKDAFLYDTGERLLLFHRPYARGSYRLQVSELPREQVLEALGEDRPARVRPLRSWTVLEPAPFEVKLGWGAPPVLLDGGLLLLLHALARDGAYRVLALLLDPGDPGEAPRVVAVSRQYIMEPRLQAERYGDRPYTVFPCGASLVDGDTLVISYGAADTFAAVARAGLGEVLEQLVHV